MLIIAVAIVALSCKSEGHDNAASELSSASVDSVAVYCYNLQVKGQFDEYVKMMLSCDSMTADYKHRQILMLRQHQVQIQKDKQGVSVVKALRTEMHDGDKFANVFLSVNYKDGSQEEILFPMVYDGKQWRIQ